MTPALLRHLGDRTFTLVDVGAREGVHPRWATLGSALRVIAFEPDEAEARRLAADSALEVVPTALAATSGSTTLHLTRSPGASSTLQPDREVLAPFPDATRFDVVAEVEVPTSSLDEVTASRATPADFVKIDVQGAALDVLQGAQRTLGELAGIEVEVEMVPLYRGQPLFGAVHEHLLGHGFVLVDLRSTYWRRSEVADMAGTKGQLVFGDALYLVDPDRLRARLTAATDPTQPILAAMLAAAAYGLREWVVSYAELAPGRFDDVVAAARSRTFASATPAFRWRMLLGHFAKDIGDALITPRGSWAVAEQGIGSAPRHHRLPRLR